MPIGQFYFLVAGMLDLIDPDRTDPIDELVQKRVKALMAAKAAKRAARRRR